jgi:hypothetical protein
MRSLGGLTLLAAALLTNSAIAGAEYLHYAFPKGTISVSDGNGATTSLQGSQSVEAVKGHLSYLFPIH